MHLLPQSFEVQTAHSSSQGCLYEQRHSSSQSLFNSFESLPHLLPRQAFSFWAILPMVKIELQSTYAAFEIRVRQQKKLGPL